MKLQPLSTKTAMFAMKSRRPCSSQGVSEVKISTEELMSRITKRKWMLDVPDTKIHQIMLSSIQGQQQHSDESFGNISFRNNPHPSLLMEKDTQHGSFYLLRDDLLHPLVNGNKARKLDALLPLLVDHSVTDVDGSKASSRSLNFGQFLLRLLVEAVKVHMQQLLVAVSCAEAGIKSHLLLRGEQPEVLTGYNLISTLYGNVTYVPRHIYAHRESMLKSHANTVAGNAGHILWCDDILATNGSSSALNMKQMDGLENYQKKVLIVNEGAGDTVALLGVIRLIQYLSQDHLLGKERRVKLVADAGTGTTAIGLGLGALCLGLPWEVTGIILADPVNSYIEREKRLISNFRTQFGFHLTNHCLNEVDGGVVHWVERNRRRKFGKVMEGEIERCQDIAQETGILVDPVYTLAAWEIATELSKDKEEDGAEVVMLHTGGTLGMFGLAQRYKTYFNTLKHG
ncbi:D-cysteine desulfhydrase 2, mitochondrial isoform X2 [Euphorbia lathyris]|uniref:D-cysteine desulfhydrase 2, mitochondrial isoform X2 n=1 Tax=Euphorbia lathyris TaxID=212925 RepID=UPI0033144874